MVVKESNQKAKPEACCEYEDVVEAFCHACGRREALLADGLDVCGHAVSEQSSCAWNKEMTWRESRTLLGGWRRKIGFILHALCECGQWKRNGSFGHGLCQSVMIAGTGSARLSGDEIGTRVHFEKSSLVATCMLNSDIQNGL